LAEALLILNIPALRPSTSLRHAPWTMQRLRAGPLNAEFQQQSSSARKLDTPWEFWEAK